MNDRAALQFSRYGSMISETFSGGYRSVSSVLRSNIEPEIAVLGSILIALQIMDGLLTGFGVYLFGSGAEGNTLIRHLIESWGTVEALLFIKSIAIFVVILLCALAHNIDWMGKALKGVTAVYLLAAVLPWSYILIRHAIS